MSRPEHKSQERRRRHERGRAGCSMKTLGVCTEGLMCCSVLLRRRRGSFCFGKTSPGLCWAGSGPRSQHQPPGAYPCFVSSEARVTRAQMLSLFTCHGLPFCKSSRAGMSVFPRWYLQHRHRAWQGTGAQQVFIKQSDARVSF